jgi:hypothetical protein
MGHFDGLIEDRRQVDVRSCPENAEPGPSQKLLAMGQTHVIQAPDWGARITRYELAVYEWTAIRPMLPNKPRGLPRVNDRRVLNGIFWVLRSGAPWRDLPVAFGPYTTCYNRFVRWRNLYASFTLHRTPFILPIPENGVSDLRPLAGSRSLGGKRGRTLVDHLICAGN